MINAANRPSSRYRPIVATREVLTTREVLMTQEVLMTLAVTERSQTPQRWNGAGGAQIAEASRAA
ncbi:hypothetical protein G3T14_13995 [Methylobacterium sp. BTF04]|uniref:hypothetical protein n=1 Tax=Methylobacterium sp. BTF04 TaxID=2708300 RepID=UPI0013D803FD|nr:hypothetical protein [Methylobacterium sp. BTF04]NEU13236.1 hypothetical protein [Methylobacterium sp. BTF04]